MSAWEGRVTAKRSALAATLGLDLRAIATLRVLLGILVLASLADRLRDFAAFYSDLGVLSQEEAWSGSWFPPWDGPSWLHPFVWLPSPWSSIALFAVAAVAGLHLVFGREQREAAFLAWLMLTGLDNRNPLVIDGGDDLLRMLLFWSVFLPVSRARGGQGRVVDAATAAFVVQLALVYLMSAYHKSYRAWVSDGDALYYALHLEQFVTPIGIAVRDHVPTRLLSAGTWFLEGLGPLLLFSPFATDRIRYALACAFVALHAGIALTLGLAIFSSVCIVAWLTTLPSGFWAAMPRLSAAEARIGAPRSTPVMQIGCAVFLIYVVLWNVSSPLPSKYYSWFPFSAREPGYQLRLGQLWAMFTPAPAHESRWLELAAQTPDGAIHRLRADGLAADDTATPERLLTERWRKFHERVMIGGTPYLRRRYADYLARTFETSPGGSVARVTITPSTRASPDPTGAGLVAEENRRTMRSDSASASSAPPDTVRPARNDAGR